MLIVAVATLPASPVVVSDIWEVTVDSEGWGMYGDDAGDDPEVGVMLGGAAAGVGMKALGT